MSWLRTLTTFVPVALALFVGAVSSAQSSGQNIDVSTLPERDSVQLTIYNAEDLTLVRETRRITLRKGSNELQFSWANTLIDPTSVDLRVKVPASGVELVDTRRPFDRPEALYWHVRSESDVEAAVEITYFTSGITWAADYVGTVATDEASMSFGGFVTITNNSGEDYENASIRMVVGTINLVEKIAELARRREMEGRPGDPQAPGAPPAPAKPRGARRDRMEAAADALTNGPAGFGGGGGLAEKVIVKEGLSEYFLFTVPGEETVKSGWSKRMPLFAQKEGESVPFRIEYRYRPQEYGDQLVRLFLVRNDAASGLGDSPLPDGMVRLFRRNDGAGAAGAADGLSVLAFLSTKYVPIGQEFEFNLGRDPQVILERLAISHAREDFWFRTEDPNRLVSPTRGERIDPKYALAGWNERVQRVERVRNYRNAPITVAWRFPLDGDITFRAGAEMTPAPTLFDFRTPEFKATVAAGETRDTGYELVLRRGTNEKQSRVELESQP
jgi:hypothetical protein